MATFSIAIKNTERVIAKILKVKSELEVTPLAHRWAKILVARIRDRFLREVDPDSNPWIPSRAGLIRKSKGGGGTLYDTGRLFNSIRIGPVDEGVTTIFTDVPYAAIHQKGSGKIPARPFLGFSKEDVDTSKQIIDFIIARISKAK